MMKKVSLYWALVVGFLSVAAQMVTFYVRFGRWNTDSAFADYLLFFLAGLLGGWILIFFLNRQTTLARRWVVLITFLLASPIAMLMMVGSGLLGPVGVLLFPQIPWALFTWIGSMVAKYISGD